MKKKLIFILFTVIAAFVLFSCKDEEKPVTKEMSGNFKYYGGNYNVVQADCRIKTHSVLNPNYGNVGEPMMINVQGFELNLWSYPIENSVLLSFQITGNTAITYKTDAFKPNGFRLYMYEKSNIFKRSISGNGDSAWVEISVVNFRDSLVSGKFYTLNKSLISNGNTHYAITSGDFNNVKIK